jgi:hypothetical protein
MRETIIADIVQANIPGLVVIAAIECLYGIMLCLKYNNQYVWNYVKIENRQSCGD